MVTTIHHQVVTRGQGDAHDITEAVANAVRESTMTSGVATVTSGVGGAGDSAAPEQAESAIDSAAMPRATALRIIYFPKIWPGPPLAIRLTYWPQAFPSRLHFRLRTYVRMWASSTASGLVELRGIEPLTSAVRLQRSPI